MFRISLFLIILLFCIQSAFAVTVTVQVGTGSSGFSPAMFTIHPGDTVKWVWAAGHHNTSSYSVPAGAAPWYSNINSTENTFSYKAQVSGLYSYVCTFHSGMEGQFFVSGCNFPDKPIITSSNGNTACHKDTIRLNTQAQAGITCEWSRNGFSLPAGNTCACHAVTAGNYKVTVNRCGVDSTSNLFPITINTLPPASFTYSNTGLYYTFTNSITSEEPYDFLWSFSDATPEQTSIHAYQMFASTPENLKVTLKVTNTFTNCSDTFSLIIGSVLDIENFDQKFYSVFYEGASSIICIKMNPYSETSFSLMNIYGNIIPVNVKRDGQQYYVETDSLNCGIYLLYVLSGRFSGVEKVVVK